MKPHKHKWLRKNLIRVYYGGFKNFKRKSECLYKCSVCNKNRWIKEK